MRAQKLKPKAKGIIQMLLRSKQLKSGADLEFKKLDESWCPWQYQINSCVSDGRAWNRPGQLTYTSMANFLDFDSAEKAFEAQN